MGGQELAHLVARVGQELAPRRLQVRVLGRQRQHLSVGGVERDRFQQVVQRVVIEVPRMDRDVRLLQHRGDYRQQ